MNLRLLGLGMGEEVIGAFMRNLLLFLQKQIEVSWNLLIFIMLL